MSIYTFIMPFQIKIFAVYSITFAIKRFLEFLATWFSRCKEKKCKQKDIFSYE